MNSLLVFGIVCLVLAAASIGLVVLTLRIEESAHRRSSMREHPAGKGLKHDVRATR